MLKKEKPQSRLDQNLSNKRTSTKNKDNFKVSFQYLDTSQKFGSSFKDWQSCGLLSLMMEKIAGYCQKPLIEQCDGDTFTIYGDFPPYGYTLYKCPKNVPEDANWARMHINGSAIVIGHIVENTFYVVFLDKTHKFYLTKKDRERYFGKSH